MAKKKKRKSTKKKSAGDKLNSLQRKFGKLYASEREFFGNGVQAYARAYGIDVTLYQANTYVTYACVP